ncbi:MAG: histidine--tRNA ligase [Treponema sp.]|nr:histidine--tRNA ligase [Treponema sp.]
MKTNALKGMKDILPVEQKLRDYVQQKILETYRACGFERISTPMLEDAENLDKSDGGDNLNLIFKVLKRGEKLDAALSTNPVDEKSLSDMGLRYDLTLPLTRFYAANRNELQSPFKVIQTDRVFRAERPQKGRSREFVQCDIDILGDSSCNAEVELIDVTSRALKSIGFNDFTININDRRILRAMLENMGFASDALDSVCITFDKMDKIGSAGIEAELKEKKMPDGAVKSLVEFVAGAEAGNKILLDEVAGRCSDSSVADDLKYVISTVEKISHGDYKIEYTPSLVRGQGYYTGIVFEIACPAFKGAVGGGGRYDNLIGKFIGQDVPAVGFSIGFERICGILLETGFKIPDEKEKCAFLYDDSADFATVMSEAKKLRSDYSVSILKKAKKPGPQFAALEKQGYTKFASFKDGQVVVK